MMHESNFIKTSDNNVNNLKLSDGSLFGGRAPLTESHRVSLVENNN